jgi:hypothetical protein
MTGRHRVIGLLGVAVFLTWLNLQSPVPIGLVEPSERSATLLATHQSGSAGRQAPNLQAISAAATAPGALYRPVLELADRDPFGLGVLPKPATSLVQVPTAPAVPTAPTVAPTMPVAAPLPAAPNGPPVNMVFAGRMTAPDGTLNVYVVFGENTLAITAGQILPNGYRVDAISARAVELRYPQLNTTTRLDLPELPKFETR